MVATEKKAKGLYYSCPSIMAMPFPDQHHSIKVHIY